MKPKIVDTLAILFFCLLTFFIARSYFLNGKVPIPGNLLVSFYEPWKSYSWVGFPNGVPNKPMGFDTLRIFYPVRSLTTTSLRQGKLPLWNPYYFSGNTLLATYQSAAFYPLSFLFFLLPQTDAWSLIVIVQPLLASIFMYLFLQEIGCNKKLSLLGGFIFGFSAGIIVLMEESFMASSGGLILPLALFALHRLYKRVSTSFFFLLVVSFLWSILSGWFQMTLYVFLFSFAWALFLYFQKKDKKFLIVVLLSYVTAFFLSGVYLFPNIEGFFFSARGTTDAKFLFDTYLQPLQYIITFFMPDFFGNPGSYNYWGRGFFYEKVIYFGIVGIFFCLYSLLIKSKGAIHTFFKWTWGITLSLGFSLPTSWMFLYYLKLPFISTILPSRIFFLTTFCGVVLAMYGLQAFIEKPEKKKVITLFVCVALILSAAWLGAFYYAVTKSLKEASSVPIHNVILPTALFCILFVFIYVATKNVLIRKTVFMVCLLLSLFTNLYFANKYLYFSERQFVFPKVAIISQLQKIIGNDRYMSIGTGYIERNFGMYFNLSSPEGYDSIYIQRYGQLLFASKNQGRYTPNISRADAEFSYTNSLMNLSKDPIKLRLFSLLDVKYVVDKLTDEKGNKVLVQRENNLFKPLWSDGIYAIYQYKQALPHVFLTDSYVVKKRNQEIINALLDSHISLDKTIILEQPIPFLSSKNELQGKTQIVSYQPTTIVVKTVADKNALLFLSDTYYPGWNAYIDGKKTEIYQADYAFRAIIIPKGTHIISFVYSPASLAIGEWGSAIGILLLGAISFTIAYNKKRL